MRFFAADRIFDGVQVLDGSNTVLVYSGDRLKEKVKSSEVAPDRVTRLRGTLTPGFVNAHCHLELSHLHREIPEGTGFAAFGHSVVNLRGRYSRDEVVRHAVAADEAMRENGIALVGDICNSSDSIAVKQASQIRYHSFVELIGLHPDRSDQVYSDGCGLLSSFVSHGLSASLAAHAPYSVSTRLRDKVLRHDENTGQPFSMHFRETRDEVAFLERKPTQFDELYRRLGIDISWFRGEEVVFNPRDVSVPVLLAHNMRFHPGDKHLTNMENVFFCFCPSANAFIQNQQPELTFFKNALERVCLGTDSLAGNHALDMLREANLFAALMGVSPDDPAILKALTYNGARALNNSANFGRIAAATGGGLNLVDVENGKLVLRKRVL